MDCSNCSDPFPLGKAQLLPCLHVFCAKCIPDMNGRCFSCKEEFAETLEVEQVEEAPVELISEILKQIDQLSDVIRAYRRQIESLKSLRRSFDKKEQKCQRRIREVVSKSFREPLLTTTRELFSADRKTLQLQEEGLECVLDRWEKAVSQGKICLMRPQRKSLEMIRKGLTEFIGTTLESSPIIFGEIDFWVYPGTSGYVGKTPPEYLQLEETLSFPNSEGIVRLSNGQVVVLLNREISAPGYIFASQVPQQFAILPDDSILTTYCLSPEFRRSYPDGTFTTWDYNLTSFVCYQDLIFGIRRPGELVRIQGEELQVIQEVPPRSDLTILRGELVLRNDETLTFFSLEGTLLRTIIEPLIRNSRGMISGPEDTLAFCRTMGGTTHLHIFFVLKKATLIFDYTLPDNVGYVSRLGDRWAFHCHDRIEIFSMNLS
jgi:hypothetical protein